MNSGGQDFRFGVFDTALTDLSALGDTDSGTEEEPLDSDFKEELEESFLMGRDP